MTPTERRKVESTVKAMTRPELERYAIHATQAAATLNECVALNIKALLDMHAQCSKYEEDSLTRRQTRTRRPSKELAMKAKAKGKGGKPGKK